MAVFMNKECLGFSQALFRRNYLTLNVEDFGGQKSFCAKVNEIKMYNVIGEQRQDFWMLKIPPQSGGLNGLSLAPIGIQKDAYQ